MDMGFVTSDIDLSQMEKAKGWSDLVYQRGWQIGHLGAWRAEDIGSVGSNLSMSRGMGTSGSNLSVWRASKGLNNIVTTSGKTSWDGDALVLMDKGASATISPWGGDAVIQITKEHQHRDCKRGQLGVSYGCSKYGAWVPDNTEVVVVGNGRVHTVSMNESGYRGERNMKSCDLTFICYSDWKYRTRIQLVSFIPDETQSGGGGGGQTDPGGGPIPATPPGAGPTPMPGVSPVTMLPWVAGIGIIAVVGIIAYKFIVPKAQAVVRK